MICKVCLGKGWILNENYTDRIECPACHGTKETDPTNEDWLRQASVNELVKWISEHMNCNYCPKKIHCRNHFGSCEGYIEEWLREKHKG